MVDARWVVNATRHDRGDHGTTAQLDTALHGLRREGEVGGPGADDRLTRHGEAGQGTWSEFGHPAIHLVGRDDFARVVPVALGLVPQGGQRVTLLVGPCDEQRAGALHGDADLLGVLTEKVVAARDQSGFQGSGSGVEAGVQQGGVGLAGAVTDVVAPLDQRHGQSRARQCAGDGASDDSRADDRDVADLRRGVHDRVSFCVDAAAACRQRSRCSAARSAGQSGS